MALPDSKGWIFIRFVLQSIIVSFALEKGRLVEMDGWGEKEKKMRSFEGQSCEKKSLTVVTSVGWVCCTTMEGEEKEEGRKEGGEEEEKRFSFSTIKK